MPAAAANLLVANTAGGEITELEDRIDQNFKSFANFDIVTYPPFDHHFINAPYGGSGYSYYLICSARRLKSHRENRIKKDWELLKTNLPNSIFVRTYTERIDLMRVAIIGLGGGRQGVNDDYEAVAATNPYGYGLFFFDVYFPPQYPEKPPSVSHIFQGMSLEQQQQSSLIFYFKRGGGGNRMMTSCFGKDVEDKWDPETSNVLQVLGFIQGQVLNVKDYSRFDDVFVMSHKAMKWTLVDPPLGFEVLVRGYFRKFSHRILLQLKLFLKKKQQQQELIKNKIGGGGGGRGGVVSLGWSTFDILLQAFEENGSYCQHFVVT